MSTFFARFVKTAAELGGLGGRAVYARQMQTQRANAPTKRKRKETCTPCAAKKKGAEMANRIWKGR